MTLPPALQTFQTAHGARIVTLPLEAFPGFYACAYLVQVDDWLVLIDTGSGSERSHQNLLDGLAQASRELGHPVGPADLTHILITHGHIDHFGGLTRLREQTLARIGVHELDYPTVVHHESRLALMSQRLGRFLAQTGVDPTTRAEWLRLYRFTKMLYRSVPVDLTYEATHMTLGPFEFLHVPGHCPGHVAIRLHDVVFCGDLIIEGNTPHLAPEEMAAFSGVRHYLASLSSFLRWAEGARWILSGHGLIPAGVARATEIRNAIARRLRQTLQAFEQPNTILGACQQVYGEVSGYRALLVIEKMGAYVEYLYQHGWLEIANPEDLEKSGVLSSEESLPVIRYCRSSRSRTDLISQESAYVFL